MRKVLVVLCVILLVLLGAIIAVPFLFKGKIVQLIKTKINEEIVATVNFDNNIGLNLIRNFPNLSLSINDISVIGKDSFDGDTLLTMDKFHASIDIMSVITGDEIRVKTISLNRPYIQAIVLESGRANWDITKPSDEQDTTTQDTAASEFKIALKGYEINDGHIIYDDRQGDMYAEILDLDHSGKGDFTKDIFVLETKTSIEELTFKMEGIPYLNKVKTELKCDLEINNPESRYAFQENVLKLNAFEVGFDGFVALPDENIEMDIKLLTKETGFKELLSLVPGIYTQDFDRLQASGNMTLGAAAKGILNTDREKYPAFDVKLSVENGTISYTDLPEKLNNIILKLAVNNADGVLDHTVVDMSRLHFELGQEPFDARLLVRTPMSNPYLEAALKGKVTVDNVQKLFPLEAGTKIGGELLADVEAKGHVSTLESGDIESFDAKGKLEMNRILYSDDSLAYDVKLNYGLLNFTPQVVTLEDFNANIGHSDIRMAGEMSNFFGYMMRENEVLKGRMQINSNLFDANTFLTDGGEEQKEAPAPADTVEMEAFEVPKNIDFELGLDIKKLLYDNLTLMNTGGKAAIRDQKLLLTDFGFDAFDGNINLNGEYNSQNPSQPLADMKLDIKSTDIPKLYQYFNTVQKLAPIAQNITGKMDASLTFKTLFAQNMDPILNSIESEGFLKITDAVLKNFTPVNKMADVLKMPQFKELKLQNVNISYKVEDGKISLKENLNYNVDQINMVVEEGGSTGFDQSLDYKMRVNVPRAMFGSTANTALEGLLKEAGKAGVDLKPSDKININVLMGGTVQNPKITTSLKELSKSATEQVKEEVKKVIEEKKKEVIDKTKEEAAKLIADAERRGDQLIAEARKQADNIRAEARTQGERITAEANTQAQKLVKEAGNNPLKKVAAEKAGDKLKQEAKEQVNKLNAEADRQANQVIQNAEAEKRKLVEDARKKAE